MDSSSRLGGREETGAPSLHLQNSSTGDPNDSAFPALLQERNSGSEGRRRDNNVVRMPSHPQRSRSGGDVSVLRHRNLETMQQRRETPRKNTPCGYSGKYRTSNSCGDAQGWIMEDTSELTTFLLPQSGLKGRQKHRSLHHRRDSPLI